MTTWMLTAARAKTAGGRSAGLLTNVPTRTVEVACAIAVSATVVSSQ